MESFSFEKSLKPVAVEEFLDFYFYRRIAYRMVPWFIRLGVTPNQVTTLSLISGLIASALVFKLRFIPGAGFAILAILLDCSDGQLARLTGKVSPYGRAMDGLFDAVWITTLWLAIKTSGYFQLSGAAINWLMIPAAISFAVHCWRFDGVKTKYLEWADTSFREKDLDVDSALSLMKHEIKNFRFFYALLAACVAFQVYFFVRGKEKKKPLEITTAAREEIRQKLEPLIDGWSWLGESHHNTLFIGGLFLAPFSPIPLLIAFWIILIPMNIWYFYSEIKWQKALKELKDRLVF